MRPELEAADPFQPWYLTVVRTQGIQFIRAEKSCRPIVSVKIINAGHTDGTHEVLLGPDGRSVNLKSPFVLREVDLDTYLDIAVEHKPAGKNKKRRHLIGTAYVSVGELLKRQARAGAADVDLKLTCPPPQKRSPTIGGSRQLGCASITVRLRCPVPVASSSVSVTAVESPVSSGLEDEVLSEGVMSDVSVSIHKDYFFQPNDGPTPTIMLITKPEDPSHTIRRRKKKPKIRGYTVNTDDEDDHGALLSSPESLSYPPSPTHSPSFDIIWDKDEVTFTDGVGVVLSPSEDWIAPRVLPRFIDQVSLAGSMSLSAAETLLDWIAPYRELTQAEEDQEYEKVLGKMLTEWYVVGGSLLAVIAVDAAVFGFSSDDTIFAVDGIAKRSVVIGSIAAGIGLAIDVWFIIKYSGADGRKFQRAALDVYNTYFFFCLTCRFPTLCLLVAACALMVFLLAVAYVAWPDAVLVMSVIAGMLMTLQYLVYGFHRAGNVVVWVVRWRYTGGGGGIGGRAGRGGDAEVVDAGYTEELDGGVDAGAGYERDGHHRARFRFRFL
ncbi:hypothetical protein EIP91_011005 [Steccherinum ochraceum]|uniref:Uncharacterized protein n=1 Tax=Steccherinum ochraceum TaxID=92696 RepID=A0A4R0RBU6_9APHY|nr:hypothetical protein EIP91_011005 [Steccherinum ochraceum]